MKLNTNLLIGGSVLIIAFLLWKMKKNKDLQLVKDKQAEINYADKLQQESKAYAESMNVDLINEKKAKVILGTLNLLEKQLVTMPTHTASYKPALDLKKQISDLKLQLKDLGYKYRESAFSLLGGTITKI